MPNIKALMIFVMLSNICHAVGFPSYYSHTSDALLWNAGGGADDGGVTFEAQSSFDYYLSKDKTGIYKTCLQRGWVYIYELDARKVQCTYDKQSLTITLKGVRTDKEYLTVSRNPIPFNSWGMKALKQNTVVPLRKFATSVHKSRKNNVTKCNNYRNVAQKGGIKAYEFKVDGDDFYLTPICEAYGVIGDDNIVSGLLRKHEGQLQYIGAIEGELIQIADIDRDGFPELLINKAYGDGAIIGYFNIKMDGKLEFGHVLMSVEY